MIGPYELDDVYHADALAFLRDLPDACIDAVITDPPYAEVSRDYGRLTEAEWFRLMKPVVRECRRVLKPSGSAVFIVQPNMRHLGQMRLWVWEFLLWAAKYWNLVQNVYWWNYTAMPGDRRGLMRSSVKLMVWLGAPDCHRDQSAILWKMSDRVLEKFEKAVDRLSYFPSGRSVNEKAILQTAIDRGGTTPFNLLPMPNSNSASSAGAFGHGAGTPAGLVEWWVRYIAPPGGVVCDPFMGSGTTGLVARDLGRRFIGCDKEADYVEIARVRLGETFVAPEGPEAAPGLVQMGLFEQPEA